MSISAEFTHLRARRAALVRWSKEDPTEAAHHAQAGLLAKFEREVDPDGVLPPEERLRRAQAARKAFMVGIAAKSAQVRRARRRQREKAAGQEVGA
jgi:hypothetical protein